MSTFMRKLWHEDAGAIIAAEYLFIATLLVIGVLVGFASVRDAVNTEFAELSNAFLGLSQGFILSGQSGCCSATDGSQSVDLPALVPDPTCTVPAIPSVIDTIPCN